jgi:nicotinamide mononucleotide transporter
MELPVWLSNNYIEIFGAVTGILYVFLEIRQNIWLWPVGIVTSAVYILVFFSSKFYADMSLQGYYLVISVLGWYWWIKGAGQRAQGAGEELKKSPLEGGSGGVSSEKNSSTKLKVTRINFTTAIILAVVFIVLFATIWLLLDRLTDSPVPAWDSFITSLSIVATWMLARKIYEHWYLWIIVNAASVILFITRGLYPTVILYIVYCAMSVIGLREWKRSL